MTTSKTEVDVVQVTGTEKNPSGTAHCPRKAVVPKPKPLEVVDLDNLVNACSCSAGDDNPY